MLNGYLFKPLPLELNIIEPLLLLARRCLLGVMNLFEVVEAPLFIDFIVVDPMKDPPAFVLFYGFKS